MKMWASEGEAPAWYAAAANYRADTTKYCAEDGALFNVEFTAGTKDVRMRCESWMSDPFRTCTLADTSAETTTDPSWSIGVGFVTHMPAAKQATSGVPATANGRIAIYQDARRC